MLSKLRATVGVAMIWLLTVAGVSATAWFAVDRAGHGLTGGAGSLSSLSAATARGRTPRNSAPPTAGAGHSSGSPSGPSGPSGSPSKASGSGSEPTRSASGSASSASGASDTPSSASGSPSSAPGSPSGPAGSTTPRDRTVGVPGGQVSVRCTGATILLRIAQPDNGWRVEVGASGPQQVAVTFQRGDESPGGETKVGAVCANGAPAITVDTKG